MCNIITIFLSSLLLSFREWDIRILRDIYENRYTAYDSAFILITDTAAAIAFGVPLIMLIAGLLKKNKILWRNALAIFFPVAISAIVANILKFSFDMPRPYELYPFIEKLSSGGSPSFPSGHTADAFAFAIATGLIYFRWYILLPALIWAGLVGLSRMWLGVHFPSDVIAGAFIGVACAGIYYFVANKKLTKAG